VEIPPAVVIGRVIAEIVPFVVRRIFRLKRAEGIVFAIAVEVAAVAPRVAENAVDDDSDTFGARRVDKVLEVLICKNLFLCWNIYN